MSESYLLKVNAQPRIIADLGIEKIKNEIIPQAIKSSFRVETAENISIKLDDDIENDDDYKTLCQKTNEFMAEYTKTRNNLDVTGKITYEKDFLTLIKWLKQARKDFTEKHPALYEAYEMRDKSIRENLSFVFDSRMGTGIDHILKMEKIRQYLESKKLEIINAEEIGISYDIKNEFIVVKTENDKHLFSIAKILEKKINQVIEDEISINPIFDKIELVDDVSSGAITVVVNYPNSNTDDELKALLSDVVKETEANEAIMEFKQPNKEKLQAVLQSPARAGYIKEVSQNKRTLIDFTKSVFRKNTEVNYDEQRTD
jgi:hypothetical protein